MKQWVEERSQFLGKVAYHPNGMVCASLAGCRRPAGAQGHSAGKMHHRERRLRCVTARAATIFQETVKTVGREGLGSLEEVSCGQRMAFLKACIVRGNLINHQGLANDRD